MPPFDQLGAQLVTDGGPFAPVRIPSGSAGSAIILKAAPGRLCRVVNPLNVVQSVNFLFYDDPAGNPNNLIFTWRPNASDSISLQILCTKGITVIPSTTTTGDVLVEIV